MLGCKFIILLLVRYTGNKMAYSFGLDSDDSAQVKNQSMPCLFIFYLLPKQFYSQK